MNAISVVRASLEDAGRVATILARAFAPFEPLYTPAAFRATTPQPGELAGRLAAGPTWIAEVSDTSVGTVSAVVRGSSLYLRSMAVVPAARGCGVGGKLLAAAEEFGRNEGCTRIVLSTTPFLASAIALYEASGFRRSGNGPHDLHGTPLFTMVKDLVRDGPPGS